MGSDSKVTSGLENEQKHSKDSSTEEDGDMSEDCDEDWQLSGEEEESDKDEDFDYLVSEEQLPIFDVDVPPEDAQVMVDDERGEQGIQSTAIQVMGCMSLADTTLESSPWSTSVDFFAEETHKEVAARSALVKELGLEGDEILGEDPSVHIGILQEHHREASLVCTEVDKGVDEQMLATVEKPDDRWTHKQKEMGKLELMCVNVSKLAQRIVAKKDEKLKVLKEHISQVHQAHRVEHLEENWLIGRGVYRREIQGEHDIQPSLTMLAEIEVDAQHHFNSAREAHKARDEMQKELDNHVRIMEHEREMNRIAIEECVRSMKAEVEGLEHKLKLEKDKRAQISQAATIVMRENVELRRQLAKQTSTSRQ